MSQTILNTIITFAVSGALGYCVNVIKDYRKRDIKKAENDNIQNIALLTLLQTQLTNTYFVYEKLGEIPDYVYKNWLNMLSIYEKLGGDDFVHDLASKMRNWKIVKTDILK